MQVLTNIQQIIDELSKEIDPKLIVSEPEDLLAYESDATHDLAKMKPDVVILPNTTEEVSKVIKFANLYQIPVTPRGAGSGLAGGSTPIKKGLVLDLKRMNKIIEINRGNMTAVVESGVVLGDFHRAVEKQKLFYPPDPQSMAVCTIGGNIATRAGGPRGVKYGTTSHYVLGLEVVLPDGEIINTGGTCVKHSTGYDLTHLFAGSEGTLGVITKANLRLLPLPATHRTVIVTCETAYQASKIISEIIARGVVPAMLEFISLSAMTLLNKFLIEPLVLNGEAYLFLDLDGEIEQIRKEIEKVQKICNEMNVVDIRFEEDEEKSASYWIARSNLYPSLVSSVKKLIPEDVTVPRNLLSEFITEIGKIPTMDHISIGVSGHAGDGNFHPTIMLTDINSEIEQRAQEIAGEIIQCALKMKGGISGEHGIGLHKAQFIEMELGSRQLKLQKQIKNAIDPMGIMNPGKIWLEESE